MSANVLISGHLWRDPQRRTTQAGKPFAIASLRVPDGDAAQWWHVTVFAEDAVEVLMQLGKGDALAAAGPMQARIFEAATGPRVNLSMIANRLISARPVKRERDKPSPRQPSDRLLDDHPFAMENADSPDD